MSDLRARLRALGLLTVSSSLDDLVALATKKRWGPTETLEHVADLEEKDRARRGLERRMSRSRLEKFKPMADFDWNWPSAIDRPLVESLLSLDFLEGARNVVLVAPGGLGKTMIAPCCSSPLPSCCSTSGPKSPRAPSSGDFTTTQRLGSSSSTNWAFSPSTIATPT
jgi:DNA replication protein DnaC